LIMKIYNLHKNLTLILEYLFLNYLYIKKREICIYIIYSFILEKLFQIYNSK